MNNFNKRLIPLVFTAIYATQSLAATTIIDNINGYTIANDKLKRFTAIQFTDDEIDKVYLPNEAVKVPVNAKVINGKGKTMLPGLIDAHGHVQGYGHSLLRVNLIDSKSEQEAAELTFAYRQKYPETSWILGRGWNQERWSNKSFPTAASLDQLFPNTPVWLRRVDGHAGWANSKAMQLAGITAKTTSPTGGEIIRDSQGQPTGVFIDNAVALIEKYIATPSQKDNKVALKRAMASLASMGLTSVHDAGIDEKNLKLYMQLASDGEMLIRINAMLYLPTDNWQKILKQGPFTRNDDKLTFNSVKIQADGALGSRGAALISDYSDHTGHRGLLLHSDEELNEYIHYAMKHGFQVNTHAIGDDANKKVLDMYQSAIATHKTKQLRHRVEHAQVLRLEDIPRFAKLNVIASMQATHATSDKNMAENRLGPDRIKGAYAWQQLLASGAVIAAGSDFPVESPNPFYGLHASITRQDKANQPQGGWYNKEAMTPVQALRSFTLDAAYAGHQETLIGSLSKGKKADFIMISDDIFTMQQQDIWRVSVDETWVAGERVFKRK